ncbi:MAG: response regulator transcription factor [Gammaproteobacteria bacterium]
MSSSDTTTLVDHHASTVVIIEPDEITRDSLVFLLESDDVNVDTFPSAEDFLTKFTNQNYACLITEMSLPGTDGLGLINKLTQLNKQLPTIILTQSNDVSMAVRAMRAGAVDFIEKPFVEPMLLERVMQILAHSS